VVQVEGRGRKSKEQLEAEKKAILKQRIKPLEVDGLDASKLTEKAKELHTLIYRLEGEKYDLEKRFKSQQIDVCNLMSCYKVHAQLIDDVSQISSVTGCESALRREEDL